VDLEAVAVEPILIQIRVEMEALELLGKVVTVLVVCFQLKLAEAAVDLELSL
jgi:hypothetical protein